MPAELNETQTVEVSEDLIIGVKEIARFLGQPERLQDRDVLIVKADGRDALVVLPIGLAIEIAVAAERQKL